MVLLLYSCGNNCSNFQISADTGDQMTSQEMHHHIIRVAVNLLNTGLHKGDVICIAAKNSKHVAPVVFAALLLGLTVNTMDPDFDLSEMAHSLNLAKPKVIFCDDENTETVTRTLSAIDLMAEVFVFKEEMLLSSSAVKSVNELFKSNVDEKTFLPPNLGDISNLPAVILCSSGTTGLPKGVCISHQSMLTQLRRQWDVTTDDVLFSFSSLYWLSGWIILLNGMLNGATRIITKAHYSPDLFLSLIEKHRITSTVSAPHQMMLMLQSDKMRTTNLDSLKTVMVGGSYVSDTLKEGLQKFVKNGKVLVAYGATETAGFISMTLYYDCKGSVGQLGAGTRVKVGIYYSKMWHLLQSLKSRFFFR
jgi:4-coumarate--CoA ligase